MSILDIPSGEAGLIVFVGSQVDTRVAPSVGVSDIVDFTVQDNILLRFPMNSALKKTVDIIEQNLLGRRTTLKFLGKEQILGDTGDILSPNGMAWIANTTLNGTVISEMNDKGLISIESASEVFTIEFTRDTPLTGDVLSITIARPNETDVVIPITGATTINDIITAINAVDGLSSFLHIGEGTEIVTFPTGIDVYSEKITAFVRWGDLTVVYQNELAPFIQFLIPKIGSPNYFNLLNSSSKAPIDFQYIGTRIMNWNVGYANNALTTSTNSLWAGSVQSFTGVPVQDRIEDVESAYTQTNGRTRSFLCGVEATSVSSAVNNFAWSVEPNWNINNQPYEIPNEKYNDTFDFSTMFNSQSKAVFETRVLANDNISTVLETTTFGNGKQYHMIKSAKTLLGQPQFPDLASDLIPLDATGFNAIDNPADPFTSMWIITSDIEYPVNYTEAELKIDFPAYDPN